MVETLSVAKESGGIGSRPEELIFVKLVSIRPPVSAGRGERLEGKVILSSFP